MLVDEGHSVDIACNYNDLAIDQLYNELGCKSYQIDFSRSPLSKDNIIAYKQLKELIINGKYDIVHCHTPNASVITRLVCKNIRKKNNLKVFYTAHGFHFYKGAPFVNWLIFYPIEKICSRWTDVLVTITHEDYQLAQNKMDAKEVVYVPGVGINTADLAPKAEDATIKIDKRKELGLSQEDIVMLSVGELNKNKNHEILLRAMAQLGRKDLHYVIAGRGNLKEKLEQLAQELGVSGQLHLLGFRTDAKELFKMADFFAHPSFREGLSVAVMEAMASGLPIICSEIRGNIDLIKNNEGGFLFRPAELDTACQALKNMLESPNRNSMGLYNLKKAEELDVNAVLEVMKKIYA